MQSADERHNLMTHNQRDGKLVRVISEFVGRDRNWVEYQAGQVAASFREQSREGGVIYMYDGGRSMWLKIETDSRGGLALGFFAWGPVRSRPTAWNPGPPPMKWSDSRYGFAIEEDCNGEEETQAGRDRCEVAAG
jgi:hypothetical protein